MSPDTSAFLPTSHPSPRRASCPATGRAAGPLRTAIWATVAVALAVTATLALSRAFSASAAPGDTDATYNPTAGCRVTDTRAPDNIGPRATPLGAGEVFEVTIHGDNGECTGDLAIPSHATGIAANVTAVGATTSSNLRIYPADLSEVPLLSNLNVTAGGPPTPNKVDVQLSPDGKIKVYNFQGFVNVVIDIVGFYTPSSLQELAAGGTPGPPGPQGPQGPAGPAGIVEMHHGIGPDQPLAGVLGADVDHMQGRIDVETLTGGERFALKQIHGPASIAGADYALATVRFCLGAGTPGAFLSEVGVIGGNEQNAAAKLALDSTPRSAPGCYQIAVNETETRSGYMLAFGVTGDSANDSVGFNSISTTWTPLT